MMELLELYWHVHVCAAGVIVMLGSFTVLENAAARSSLEDIDSL